MNTTLYDYYLEDRRQKKKEKKKNNPLQCKFEHMWEILWHPTNAMRYYLKDCGWRFESNGVWKYDPFLFRVEETPLHKEMKEFVTECHKFKVDLDNAFKEHSGADMKRITSSVQKTALKYFERAYELYKWGYNIGFSYRECTYFLHCAWFEKNINKLRTVK